MGQDPPAAGTGGGRGALRLVVSLSHAEDTSMRVTSGRAAPEALLLVGLAVLAVAGRLLPSVPSAQRPATTAATGTTSAPAIRTAPGNTRGYGVPDVLGRTLAQAERMMRTGGLHGGAYERDPQGRNAVVVAKEPPAGVVVPPGSMVGFRTRTGVQPYDAPRQLRLGAGPHTAAYRIVAPDPATHQLTVALVAPRAADVEVWLETRSRSRVPVLASTRDAKWCRPSHGKIQCEVRLGIPAQGVWTASVAKRSALPEPSRSRSPQRRFDAAYPTGKRTTGRDTPDHAQYCLLRHRAEAVHQASP